MFLLSPKPSKASGQKEKAPGRGAGVLVLSCEDRSPRRAAQEQTVYGQTGSSSGRAHTQGWGSRNQIQCPDGGAGGWMQKSGHRPVREEDVLVQRAMAAAHARGKMWEIGLPSPLLHRAHLTV